MSDWTPTARTTVASGADAIRYSNSAVFPIPASPRSTSDRLSPRPIAETRSSSSAHSLARPRRRGPLPGPRNRASAVIGDLVAAPGRQSRQRLRSSPRPRSPRVPPYRLLLGARVHLVERRIARVNGGSGGDGRRRGASDGRRGFGCAHAHLLHSSAAPPEKTLRRFEPVRESS